MARAYPMSDAELGLGAQPGEWHALRGELVALLDQVEGRYAREAEPEEPRYDGLARRVRALREQVGESPGSARRREALRSVKRAVERFSDRPDRGADEPDDLRAAIAEIRSRQMGFAREAMSSGRRGTDSAPLGELAGLVTVLSERLERLEGELRAQRSDTGIAEVAAQLDQLTHVVELLASTVGETGQVSRLEGQMGALARLIEEAPRPDLDEVNARLDEVTATVGKLAQLQAQHMEHAISRAAAPPPSDPAVAPAMAAIENGVRNIYDRIDTIEKSVGLSQGDLDRLTGDVSGFAHALATRAEVPEALLDRLDGLAARVGAFEDRSEAMLGLREDFATLRSALVEGFGPRFAAIESRIDALGERLAQPGVDAGAVEQIEDQLQMLLARMDETGAQIADLARLSPAPAPMPEAELERMAETMAETVARKVSASVTRLKPAKADDARLGAIEARMEALVEGVASLKPAAPPDTGELADLVAARTLAAVERALPRPGAGAEALGGFETRMAALINTTGRDTAQRLARLETALNEAKAARPPAAARGVEDARPAPDAAPDDGWTEPADAPVFEAPAMAAPETSGKEEDRLAEIDTVFAALSAAQAGWRADKRDTMPANPAEDAPLFDPGAGAAAIPPPETPRAPPLASGLRKLAQRASERPEPEPASAPDTARRPDFDPETVERPAPPVSTLADPDSDPFAPPPAPRRAEPEVEIASTPLTSQSTFIAAARRAQRAKLETGGGGAGADSLIARALARVMPQPAPRPTETPAEAPTPRVAERAAEATTPEEAPAKPARTGRRRKAEAGAEAEAPPAKKPGLPRLGFWPRKASEEEKAAIEPSLAEMSEPARAFEPGASVLPAGDDTPPPSFLMRYRRPLLLAAALVAVSVLALNLALQRTGDAPARPAAESPAESPGAASGGISDLFDTRPAAETAAALFPALPALDATATGSIGNGAAMSFTRADAEAAMPQRLVTPAAPAMPVPPLEGPVSFDPPPAGVGPDPLRHAAANGDMRAQFEVGAIYTEGQAVPQDLALAATWYERSAAQGFVPAQYRLGNLYETGAGVGRDLSLARLWYQRAAEAGNRTAMHNLAAIHASGELGGQSFETAAQWFEEAAQRGMTDSQFNLGMLYARGLGVEQDFEQSYKWFTLAARNGDADAERAREDVARSLSAEAVGRIVSGLESWTATPIDLAANFAPIGTWAPDFDPGEAIANPGVIQKVQAALGRLGYDIGQPDGVIGPRTREAIRAFEAATGMSPSGAVNPRLIAVLGSQPI